VRQLPHNTRVCAIRNVDPITQTIYFFGSGIYLGEQVPKSDGSEGPGGELGELIRLEKCRNPKIRLDNGDIVWGAECHWGEEKDFEAMLAGQFKGYKMKTISITDCRKGIELNEV
jgi:hypothetical protein